MTRAAPAAGRARPRRPPPRGQRAFPFAILAVAILACGGVALYANTLRNPMVFDDVPHLVDSSDLHDLAQVDRWWRHDPRRPIGYLGFALNYHFGRLDVTGYHLVNLLIHVLNACLVLWLARMTLSTPGLSAKFSAWQRNALPLFAALLFMAHPVQTQAVTYIIQRLASQATLFYLLSLALYVSGRVSRRTRSWRALMFAGAIVSGVLAMLTKEIAFTLPLAIALYEVCFLSVGPARAAFDKKRVAFAALGLVGGLLVVPALLSFDVAGVLRPIPPEHGTLETLTPGNYLLTQFRVLVTYMRLVVLPIAQNLDYDYPISRSLLEWRTLASLVWIVLLLGFAGLWFRKRPLLSFGILWFFLTLAVESSFIPIADVIFEHRLYLAMFGVCLVVIDLFAHRPPSVTTGILAAAVAVVGFLTYQRNAVWHDPVTLWRDTAAKSPNKARPQTNLGNSFADANRPEEAEPHLKRAVEINPNYVAALNNLGGFYHKRRRYEVAEPYLRRSVELDPADATSQYNLGTLYLDRRDLDRAGPHLRAAVALSPTLAMATANLGNYFFERGEDDSALFYSERAVAIDPGQSRALNNLGRTWRRKGDLARASSYYERAIQIEPGAADILTNIGNLGLAGNDLAKAETYYRRALGVAPGYAGALDGLGLVHYRRGDVASAVQSWQQAVAANPSSPDLHDRLAMGYEILGRSLEAAESRRKAQALRVGR